MSDIMETDYFFSFCASKMNIPLARAVCPCASFSSINRISLNPTSLFTHYLCKMAFISTLGTAVGHPSDPSDVHLQVLHLSGITQ